MKTYPAIEWIHRLVYIFCSVMLCVEYDTNFIVTFLIGGVVIVLAFLNPIPFVNQTLIMIPFLIRVFTHKLFVITWVSFIIMFAIWGIMIIIMVKEYIRLKKER